MTQTPNHRPRVAQRPVSTPRSPPAHAPSPSPQPWPRNGLALRPSPKSRPRPLHRERSRLPPFAGAAHSILFPRVALKPCAAWLKLESHRRRLLSGPLVDVTVGSGAATRSWTLHRNLLAYHSAYLAQRIGGGDTIDSADSGYGSSGNGDASPSPDRTPDRGKAPAPRLDLPDDAPHAFELLLKWLYQGALDDVGARESADAKWEHAFACQKLYALAERLDLRAVKNAAIDQFRAGCYQAGLVPGPEEMGPVYATTPPGSPFRTLVSQVAARQIMDPETKRDAATYRACFQEHVDFAIDVMNAIRDESGGQLLRDPTEGGGCMYHEHDDGEKCPAKSWTTNGNGILKYTWSFSFYGRC